MEIKDIMFFRQLVKSQPYNSQNFNLDNLFRAYSSEQIFSIEDFAKVPDEFAQLVMSIKDCYSFERPEDRLDFERDFSGYTTMLKNIFKPRHFIREDKYTLAVKELAPSKQQTKILEVGSGQVPHSSIILAKECKNVSSMDKFIMSPTCLERLGVQAIHGYFNSSTDVSDFDFVVGQRPCSAIESMVATCQQDNKPYFIELCDCNLNEIAKRDGVYRNWQQILPSIDPDVKFVDNVAFNVDITERQMSNLLHECRAKCVERFRQGYSLREGFKDSQPETSDMDPAWFSDPVQA